MNETTVAQAKTAESHYFTPEHDILMFNEHAYVKRMTACGFNEQQAEALAAEQGDLLNNLATRADIEKIDRRFDKVEQEIKDIRQNMATKEELEGIRQNMATKLDLDVAINRVKADMANAKTDMAKWMVGQLILIVGFIFTLNKFVL